MQVLKQQEADVRDRAKAESTVAIESVVAQKQHEVMQLSSSLVRTKQSNIKALKILQKQAGLLRNELQAVRA